MTGFLSAQSRLCFIARSSLSHTWCYKQLLPVSLTCKNISFPSGPWSRHQPERCTTYSTRRAARSGSVRIHGGSEGTESGRGSQAVSPGPPTLRFKWEKKKRPQRQPHSAWFITASAAEQWNCGGVRESAKNKEERRKGRRNATKLK